jgi:hypothetical protein
MPSGGATAPYVVLNANTANPYTLTSYTLTNLTSNVNTVFGDPFSGGNGAGGGAIGYMNNFSLYPRQLTNAEITALYNQ